MNGSPSSSAPKLVPGFWDGYWKSLKPLEVEEPVDVWVHRPVAYVLARALYATPITPNMITVASIVVGVGAGACLFARFAYHLPIAGLSLFLSAVLDCADGQLARMRGTSSALGRMLDGSADLVVSSVVAAGGAYVVWSEYREPTWLGLLVLALCIVTIVTGSFHTSSYDHFKNLFLRWTQKDYREGEDYETALARYRALGRSGSLAVRVTWPVYLFYVKSQNDYIRRLDPLAAKRMSELPEFDPEHALVYRTHSAGLMRLWRTFFGFGSLVFGMSVSFALDMVGYYMFLRLVLLNALFYGYMRPAQRRATSAAYRSMGIG